MAIFSSYVTNYQRVLFVSICYCTSIISGQLGATMHQISLSSRLLAAKFDQPILEIFGGYIMIYINSQTLEEQRCFEDYQVLKSQNAGLLHREFDR